MKLATYAFEGRETFGLVVDHPANGEPWVFNPEDAEALLETYALAPTAPFAAPPRFWAQRPWPDSLAGFLALGQAGMEAARRLQDFLLRFLEQADRLLLNQAGQPLAHVELCAPIPRPRLYFGLVQNSPSSIRYNANRAILHLMPQGHTRPQGAVAGPADPVWVAPDCGGFGWNPEPAFVIGRGGRDIPIEEALSHVAGMTVVLDITGRYYHNRFDGLPQPPSDWFADATASWLGKKTDTFCPMGPWLTTMDEIGNPYDLLIYTRQSGVLRDRSHTNSMIIGIERLVSWLSSFMTLQPGDVVHMGTMGVDGMVMTPAMAFGPDDSLEGEIERVGTLRSRLVLGDREDWRPADHPSRTIHPAPAARSVQAQGREVLATPQDWSLSAVRHFWTVYGNSPAAAAEHGTADSRWPRVLNGPASALGAAGEPIRIRPRATALAFGPELAFVVGRLAKQVDEADAERYILGYLAVAALLDASFHPPVRKPATPQEFNMPLVYGRWGDGYNAVSDRPVALPSEAIRGRAMTLSVPGSGSVTGNTDEYLQLAPRVLSFLSGQITLFPGDVVTLGPVSRPLMVPADQPLAPDAAVQVDIKGIGTVESRIWDERACG